MNAREIVEMRRAFQTIDKDKSGQLTLSEVQEALIMEGMSADEVKKVFRGLNQDNQSTISYSEFLAATLSRRLYMQEERIQEAFERLDVSNTGYITAEDLKRVLGDDYDPARVEEMMKEADIGGDGKIAYDEFVKMIRDERTTMVESVKPEGPPAVRDGLEDHFTEESEEESEGGTGESKADGSGDDSRPRPPRRMVRGRSRRASRLVLAAVAAVTRATRGTS